MQTLEKEAVYIEVPAYLVRTYVICLHIQTYFIIMDSARQKMGACSHFMAAFDTPGVVRKVSENYHERSCADWEFGSIFNAMTPARLIQLSKHVYVNRKNASASCTPDRKFFQCKCCPHIPFYHK